MFHVGRAHSELEKTKRELEQVGTTLARLPQLEQPETLETINRVKTKNLMDTKGGEQSGNKIDITDWGTTSGPGFRGGGADREMVSDEFSRQHGEKIGTTEYVLTHEFGHAVASNSNKQALNNFQEAAGWSKVTLNELKKDHVSDETLAKIEKNRANPYTAGETFEGRTKTYSPIQGSKEFWAIEKTALPNEKDSKPGVDGNTWTYAHVNPAENFAEMYAKAVQLPESLHTDLIELPKQAVEKAEARVAALEKADSSSSSDDLQEAKAALASAQHAQRQRREEYRIFREDVFHTPKAVELAIQRLKARGFDDEKIGAFKRRAERAATPEQVATLEKQAQ